MSLIDVKYRTAVFTAYNVIGEFAYMCRTLITTGLFWAGNLHSHGDYNSRLAVDSVRTAAAVGPGYGEVRSAVEISAAVGGRARFSISDAEESIR